MLETSWLAPLIPCRNLLIRLLSHQLTASDFQSSNPESHSPGSRFRIPNLESRIPNLSPDSRVSISDPRPTNFNLGLPSHESHVSVPDPRPTNSIRTISALLARRNARFADIVWKKQHRRIESRRHGSLTWYFAFEENEALQQSILFRSLCQNACTNERNSMPYRSLDVRSQKSNLRRSKPKQDRAERRDEGAVLQIGSESKLRRQRHT